MSARDFCPWQAPANGQTVNPATPNPSAPTDAKELLLTAAKVNGLESPGLKPWHIVVSYDKFDEDGDNVDSGTYEEFWISPKLYK